MNTIILIIIYIVIVLLVSLLFGWLISKWKFRNYLKKLDKEIKKETETNKFKILKLEQEEADILREKNQIERRNKLIKKGIINKSEIVVNDDQINDFPEESEEEWEEFK